MIYTGIEGNDYWRAQLHNSVFFIINIIIIIIIIKQPLPIRMNAMTVDEPNIVLNYIIKMYLYQNL